MTRKLTLTLAVALYALACLAVLLALAALLPGALKLVTLPACWVAGMTAADWIGAIWNLEGQYDDGRE